MEKSSELVKKLRDARDECWGIESTLRIKINELQELLTKITSVADSMEKLKEEIENE